jgi:signal transduction histidine kinase
MSDIDAVAVWGRRMGDQQNHNPLPKIGAGTIPGENQCAFAQLNADFTFILRQEGNGRYALDQVSAGFATLTGCTPLNLADFLALIPAENLLQFKNTLDQLDPGETANLDIALQSQTGKTYWLHTRMRGELVPHSQQKQILGVAIDITKQKQAQLEQATLNHKLQVFNDITQLLLTSNSLTETLHSVLRLLKLLIPYTQGDIIEYDRLTEELHILATTNQRLSPLIYENRLPLSFVDYPLFPPWRELIYIPDLATRPNLSPFQRIQRTEGIHSLMVAPLHNQAALLGCINIGSTEPDAFSPPQRTTFLEAAHLIALHMRQARLKHQQSDHTLQLEALVEQRTADLKELVERLEESNRAKDEFLAAMSHELHTPLHLILSKASVLQDEVYGPLNPKQLRAAVVIQENGDHLLKLINNLLSISQLDANQLHLSITQVNVQNLCAPLIAAARRAARKKCIEVELAAPAGPVYLAADETRLEQILLILLDNAVKFTPEGGRVGLAITIDPIQSVVRFEVWDTGIGIDPDSLDLIFLPFRQLDGRLSREYGGAGLGLPLAHRLTQLHDGSLSVISQIGQGSRFTIALSQTADQANAAKDSAAGYTMS